MRYRPFNLEGRSSSAVSLSIAPATPDVAGLVCAALECGINTFSWTASDDAAGEAIRHALGSVGRRLLILIPRLELRGASFERQVRAAMRASGVVRFDALLLDRPGPGEVSPGVFMDLDALRSAGAAHQLAVAGEADVVQACLDRFDFDLLGVRYSLASGWAERSILKTAAGRDLGVFGYGCHVEEEAVAPAKGLARLFKRDGGERSGPYRFMHETPDWTPRQISLAFVLTEPALASVMVEARSAAELDSLAGVVERGLPVGVAAQIEMARFAATTRLGAA